MYTQGPPTPIRLGDEILVELALLQYWGVITTLQYSKYFSTIFAVRKPSLKLRHLVDLRRINYLIRHDYVNHNFPIATLAHVDTHLAGKTFVPNWTAVRSIMFYRWLTFFESSFYLSISCSD